MIALYQGTSIFPSRLIRWFSWSKYSHVSWIEWDAADKIGLDALKAAGANIVPATPAMIAEAQKRSSPIIEDWIQKASVKVPNAKAILAEFREELKKVAAGK